MQDFLFTKVKLCVEVCSAAVRFRSCVEACSVLLLNSAASWGLEWLWVAGPLSMGTEMCVCVCVCVCV